MKSQTEILQAVTRRHFFAQCGLGSLALTSLLNQNLMAQNQPDNPLAIKPTHFAPKAKNVIYLHMAGAPSQLDLFDYKDTLVKHDGSECPKELMEGEMFAFIRGVSKLLGTPCKFKQHGESGAQISELLPHLAEVADEIAIIRSMHTDQFNHAPAQLFLITGFPQPGRPSMGSWMTYGLGSENSDLPGFVVLVSVKQPDGGKACWGSGFLPTIRGGIPLRG